jgi:hypothetical protein
MDNVVLRTEAHVTVIDGALAAAVLAGVLLNVVAGGGGRIRSPRSSPSSTYCARHDMPRQRQLSVRPSKLSVLVLRLGPDTFAVGLAVALGVVGLDHKRRLCVSLLNDEL